MQAAVAAVWLLLTVRWRVRQRCCAGCCAGGCEAAHSAVAKSSKKVV